MPRAQSPVRRSPRLAARSPLRGGGGVLSVAATTAAIPVAMLLNRYKLIDFKTYALSTVIVGAYILYLVRVNQGDFYPDGYWSELQHEVFQSKEGRALLGYVKSKQFKAAMHAVLHSALEKRGWSRLIPNSWNDTAALALLTKKLDNAHKAYAASEFHPAVQLLTLLVCAAINLTYQKGPGALAAVWRLTRNMFTHRSTLKEVKETLLKRLEDEGAL